MKPIFFLSALFLIGGCQLISKSDEINPNLFQTLASSDYIYEVKEGDSLWSIAKENNLSIKELLQSNPKIRSSSIYPGDKIFISAASELIQSNVWRSPLESNQKMQTSDSWIFFYGAIGEPIRNTKAGKVVAAGSVIPGYGNIVLMEHENQFLSFYGHLKEILVNEGDNISEGEAIATLGQTEAARPMLRFQIRYQGKPVDPKKIKFK